MEDALRALGEPRRRAILELIASGERSAGDIAAQFDVTRPAISQHLTVLRSAGLVTERREGTRRLYSVRPDGVADLRAWLDAFWHAGLVRLRAEAEFEARLAADSGGKPPGRGTGKRSDEQEAPR